jgi:predicted transcriptional regulator
MRSESVQYLSPVDEEIVATLGGLGIKKTVAKTLIFLTNSKEATTHEIEQNADLRQSEVSQAIKYLREQGWITHRVNKSGSSGRPVRIYELALPLAGIVDLIEKDKMREVTGKLNLIRELREQA